MTPAATSQTPAADPRVARRARHERRTLLALTAAAGAGLLAGCGLSGVTGQDLETGMATSFAHLYTLQQDRLGHPAVTPSQLDAGASCDKGGPGTPDTGAGNTWRCIVTWQVAGIDTPARAIYRVDVQPGGRYIADGEGPRQVNGRHRLDTPEGTVTNPLWQFDGMLDIT